ncbi:SGNH/GDSL hydrolase family protein [Nocardioides caeni]|uniref:SGNH/GDSL hydrolase family protein n=1 Tax=Nocardioides caeni TaxID=574700 RepID=A0A4V4HJ60_9ACTN|nr:SGNH/GDSL hydrolase family protein [Nocardioides caeni]THV09226.1 SGNH/GDSL hydrolase family protein [Nocardioides caeni]
MSRQTVLLATALICLAGLLTGCKGLGKQAEYVALGDSYTASPYMGPRDVTDGCVRSSENYPQQVAEATDMVLKDVSCSSAQTKDVQGRQTLPSGGEVAPQLDAVAEATKLVTIGLGFNDFALTTRVMAGCPQLAVSDPEGSPCTELDAATEDNVANALEAVPDNLVGVIEAVQAKAPDARILLIGYPQIFPAGDEGCDNLPIAKGDLDFVRQVNIDINTALQSAAAQTGITYIDTFTPSEGHDICGDEPWVAGAQALDGDAVPWHPYLAEADFVADLITEALKD